MATIKISDLVPATDVAESEMSHIKLTEQELKSVVGGYHDPDSGFYAILKPFHNQPENYVNSRPGNYYIPHAELGGSTGLISV